MVFSLKIGDTVSIPENLEPFSSYRIYNYDDITQIFNKFGIKTVKAFGDYNVSIKSSHKNLQLIIISEKI
jgi:hypothetical protein